MNVYPAGAEPDSDDEDGELPAFIAEQIGHHGFNVNNVMNLFDGLDLVDYEFDIDADDFFDDDDEAHSLLQIAKTRQKNIIT